MLQLRGAVLLVIHTEVGGWFTMLGLGPQFRRAGGLSDVIRAPLKQRRIHHPYHPSPSPLTSPHLSLLQVPPPAPYTPIPTHLPSPLCRRLPPVPHFPSPPPPSAGATTLDEYRKYIEKDPALERRFQQVWKSVGDGLLLPPLGSNFFPSALLACFFFLVSHPQTMKQSNAVVCFVW